MDKEARQEVLKRTILLVADRPGMIEMIKKANQPSNNWLRDLIPHAVPSSMLPENKWLAMGVGVGAIAITATAPMVTAVAMAALTGTSIKPGSDLSRPGVMDDLESASDEVLLERLNGAIRLPLPVVRMSVASAMEMFDFGDSPMPRNGEFYLRHPVWENQYVPALEYPRRLIKEKHAAFLKLAAALGAESITLKSVKVTGAGGGLSVSAPLEQIAGSLGIGAKFDKCGAVVEAFCETFAKPSRPPFVPPALQRWVSSDTELERMAFNRIEVRALSSRISLSTTSKLGVDASVLAKVGEADVAASAHFLAASTSVWEFEVKYHDLEL